MREIDLSSTSAPTVIRSLVLGAPKSGKTHFAATAPKPLFISDVAEGGYETIRTMDRSLWWDENTPPTVWAIEDVFKDINPLLTRLEDYKAKGTFPFSTVVIDPISIYADRALAELQMNASRANKTVDNRALYGDLANHLRVFVLRVHALPCHVLWLCHVKDGGLSLAGQTAEKLPSYIHSTWLCTNNMGVGYELHTAPYGAFNQLGTRTKIKGEDGLMYGLPSPMIPSFKLITQIYGLDKPVSPAIPGYPKGAKLQWPPKPQPPAQPDQPPTQT